MNDAAPAASAPDFRAAELHREYAVAFEADVADLERAPESFFFADVSRIVGHARPPNKKRRRVAFWVAADQQHLLALLRHHVSQVG